MRFTPSLSSALPPATCQTITWPADVPRRSRWLGTARPVTACSMLRQRAADLANQKRVERPAELAVPVRRPLASTRSARSRVDPNDPSGNTLWVGTGEANACGSGCVGRCWTVQIDRRWRHLDGTLWHVRLQRSRRRLDRSQARRPEHDLRCVNACGPRHFLGCDGRRGYPHPWRAAVGPLQVHRWRRTWTFMHNGAARQRLHRRPDSRKRVTARRARRAACAGLCSIRPIRISSTQVHTRAASGDRTTPARPGPRSSLRSNAAVTTTRPMMAVNLLAGRQDTHVRGRRQVGSPYSRLYRSDECPDRCASFRRSHELQPGRPRLRFVQLSAPASAGTTTSS